MGFYAPAQLVRDAREHGVDVRPLDVNRSQWDYSLEQGDSLRLGFRQIKGFLWRDSEAIIKARTAPFASLRDFIRRTGLGRAAVERLIEADAFGSLKLSRRAARWQLLGEGNARQPTSPLLDGQADDEPADIPALLPMQTQWEQVQRDYQAIGLTLRPHPLSFFREQLKRLGVTPAAELAELPNNRPVRVAGLVLLRQRPSTAKGITFVTLEDETGTANPIVHQRTWERHYLVARTASALLVHGRLEQQDGVIHVIVARMENLTEQLGSVGDRSRDFR